MVGQFDVAQALLPVRFLQSAHRQECLCYQKQDKGCPPKKRAAPTKPTAPMRYGFETASPFHSLREEEGTFQCKMTIVNNLTPRRMPAPRD